MRRLTWCVVVTLAVWVWMPPVAVAGGQDSRGRIEGRILRTDGSGIRGASIVVDPGQEFAVTDANGAFAFDLPAGTYTLSVTFGPNVLTIPMVVVATGQTAVVQEMVDWEAGFTDELLVVAPSRGPRPLLEAVASVSLVTAPQIADEASHGQLPKLAGALAGAELTQSGLYDFNFNTRGFNSSLNRRVAVLIDGRNHSDPFFAAQEWSAIPFPLDDIATVELVRGPSAALYGANASSGVLNITTKSPQTSRGGLVRITAGQLGTANLDFRWAGRLGATWFAKGVGGVRRSGDFSVARTIQAEYRVLCPPGVSIDCLPREAAVPPRTDEVEIVFGGLRADRTFARGASITLEGGLSHLAGPIVQTGVGRAQLTDVMRPWGRFSVRAPGVNLLVAYTGRKAPGQFALNSGTNSTLDGRRLQIEGQTDRSLQSDRIRFVVGGSLVTEHVDSFDDARQAQSIMYEPVTAHQQAVFGQAEWQAAEPLRLFAAARGDFSTLHESRVSPRAGAIYTLTPAHRLRATYSDGFQVPNYSEFFLQADAAPPVNLGALNAFCAPFGVACGFGTTRVLAAGNEDLALERTRTIEIGYTGVVGGHTLLTVDYHRSRADDFMTDLLPQLGTSLGRINPHFGPWQAPEGLPAPVASQIRAAAPAILTNNFDGSTVLVAASYTNIGRVATQGVDVSVRSQAVRGWEGSLTYSWFDYDIRNPPPGLERVLLPNTPAHAASAGLAYAADRFDAGLAVRWVDRFRWSVGPFHGDVPSYATSDVTATYALTGALTLGMNVANVFDRRHWESFGGDLLRRRALASLAYEW